jgi:DNA invertase Pin-like site-specific DNA recombinase|tara:strand:+ start:3951 stop:5567 length:1617 start_codon:yes stop_codon:yes gene_type:complete
MPPRKRCAVYTRKSTEDGLEQDFNSLDAQHEACSAYILSQAHEGWEQVTDRYDDGGWSGGRIDRPALAQLLADVEAGKVDVIVVYKVDRLTRSLADFAKIVEILDTNAASFVSVTQAFNTTTSMGRLTLNVLLSFAQFEREVTGERIRDKVSASKKKGMWMGGPVPLGYTLREGKLLIDEDEAATVRHIFTRYTELQSLPALVDDLHANGILTRVRHYRNGRVTGGIPFTKGPLAHLLKNPIFAGKVRHKGKIYEGEHEAVISAELCDEVQNIIARNGSERRSGRKSRNPSLLAGIISDPDGRPMTPVHTSKAARRYRYYVSRIAPGEDRTSAYRLPAGEVERLVIDGLIRHLRKPLQMESSASKLAAAMEVRTQLADRMKLMRISEKRAVLLEAGATIAVREDAIELTITEDASDAAAESCTISIPAKLVSRGSDLRLAIPPGEEGTTSAPDPVLLKLVAQAQAAQRMMLTGESQPGVAHYGPRHFSQLLRISWLAPEIIAAIVEGRHPPALTGRTLLRATNVPLDWQGQRELFGLA